MMVNLKLWWLGMEVLIISLIKQIFHDALDL